MLIENKEDQIINDVIEGFNNEIILIGRSHYPNLTYDPIGYIVRLNSSGNIIDESLIDLFEYTYFFNIHKKDNYYVILGSVRETSASDYKLGIFWFNESMEIIDYKLWGIPDDRWIAHMPSIIDSDNNFVIAGYTTRYDDENVVEINNDSFYYKLSETGDSLYSYFYTTSDWFSVAHNIIESSCKNYYYVFHRYYIHSKYFQKLKLNKQFELIDIFDFENYYTPENSLRAPFYSPLYINDTTLLLTARWIFNKKLVVITISENNLLLDMNSFTYSPNVDETTALFRTNSSYGDNIYAAGTSNIFSNVIFGHTDSYYHLIKLNPDLTPQWQRFYGGDAYYLLYSILATKDGGCIMVGNKYVAEDNPERIRDVFIVKVDSNGDVLWQNEISINNKISIYPNPGNDYFYIEGLTESEHLIELYDINGKIVLKDEITYNNSINTALLKQGVYFYRIFNKQKDFSTRGKWIKK